MEAKKIQEMLGPLHAAIKESCAKAGCAVIEETREVDTGAGKIKIPVLVPEESGADKVYRDLYSAKSARSLLQSKIRTNQQDKIRGEFSLQKRIKNADPETQKIILEALGIA
jgi:hypothetical protein